VSPKNFDPFSQFFFNIFFKKKILKRFHQATQQQQQQPAATSSHAATSASSSQPCSQHGHGCCMAAAWACCMGMAAAWACCCFKTGMHGAWHAAASKPGCMHDGAWHVARAAARARMFESSKFAAV
jgi:hypothetical protein